MRVLLLGGSLTSDAGDNFIREFAIWTIMARPGPTHLLLVVDDILEGLREKTKEHNVTIANLTWSMVGDVVDLMGPRRMTRSILKSLKAILGDVLILPGHSFALSSNRYRPEDTQGPALVTHHFDGGWKNDHGGETVDVVV
jgi:alpha 1,6-mannosyltransferase